MTPEERLAKIEGILDQLSKTVADRGTQEQHGQRLTNLETDMRALRTEMQAEFRTLFRWMIGMWIAAMLNMWIAIAVALLFR